MTNCSERKPMRNRGSIPKFGGPFALEHEYREDDMSRLTLVAIFLCIPASYLLAQRTTAEIVGTITDSSGGTITQAQVNVINQDTGIRRGVSTNELGNYSVPLLPPGSYRITVQYQGFHPVTRTGITLAVDQTARIDFVLEVAPWRRRSR